MSIWNWVSGKSGGSGPPNGLRFRWGISTATNESVATDDITSVIFSCCKILSDNLSRMPIQIMGENDKGLMGDTEHRLYELLAHKPNGYQSPQNFWSTIEFHRNYYGNAFARIFRKGNTGKVSHLKIIHPSLVVDAKFIGGVLYYYFMNGETKDSCKAEDILHFKAVSEDGIFGKSPVYALERDRSILNNVENTVDQFYKNKATGSMALSSEVGDTRNYKVLKQAQDDFSEEYGGPNNAGKVITLPPNTKLTSIAANYGDAQMIETMKYKRNDIAGVFSIPLYMLGETAGDDAENSSLVFRNYTISPIVAMYQSELEFKLLTSKEKQNGYVIRFDQDALIEADLVSKANAISEQVKSGLMTPNEGAVKMGNQKIDGEYGDYHYVQAQMIPLEHYDRYDVFDQPKDKETDTKEQPKKKEDEDNDASS